MTVVVDASTIVALLFGTVRYGEWAESMLAGEDRVAPHLMPVEVAEAVRRRARLDPDRAAEAHRRFSLGQFELYPYPPFADRVWQLRHNVTAYDAWYVALAESLEAPLVTLDRRLMSAAGPRCAFAVPPAP